MPDAILAGFVDKIRTAITDTTDFALAVAGAGSGAALAEVVKSWFPEQTAEMADETIAMIAGFLLFYWGDRIHPRLQAFGLGVFLAAVGAWSSEFVAGFILMLKKAGA